MFGLGWVEVVIVLVLAFFAFRHLIDRRYPKFYRAFNFIFFATAFLMVAFSLFTRFVK